MESQVARKLRGSRFGDHLAVIVLVEPIDHDAVIPGQPSQLLGGDAAHLQGVCGRLEADDREPELAQQCLSRLIGLPRGSLELDDDQSVALVHLDIDRGTRVQRERHRACADLRRVAVERCDLGRRFDTEHVLDEVERGATGDRHDVVEVLAPVRDAPVARVERQQRAVRLHGPRHVDRLAVASCETKVRRLLVRRVHAHAAHRASCCSKHAKVSLAPSTIGARVGGSAA